MVPIRTKVTEDGQERSVGARTLKKSPAEAGQHLCLRLLAGRARLSGTSWRILASLQVQILDLPVPQMVENVTDTLWILDFSIAERVIEVPKISCSPCPLRSLVPEPQSAEQLVEVPTVLSPTRIALQIAEQIVGIPVPQGSWWQAACSRFSPRKFNSDVFLSGAHF